ncbi:MAG: four helix bundle protein [Flavobacteriales bacterium]|nr:four helix bundle protein [Flavobacteriales bacterium]
MAGKKGRELRVFVSKELIPLLPKSESYLLKDRITRASRSVTANISEGFGRLHDKDRNRFFIH